jgi:hypothetical protein
VTLQRWKERCAPNRIVSFDLSTSALIKISIAVKIFPSQNYQQDKGELHLLKKSTVTTREKAELSADDQTWLNILEPELCKDAAAVECLARLLFVIKKEINGGSEGVKRASWILSGGIEAIYPYTNAHKAALRLYVLSLEGELKPQDEPLNLISEAIERSKTKRR